MILIFKTQPIIHRSGHRIFGSKMARMYNAFKHYQCRQRLYKVAYRYDSRVVVITEPYTSKTFGQCGNINTH
jgi:transposase